ncbi:uncharacterized protein FOMMEDRAFT_92631, partial [Fomitiporia mediterranea MF3/22]|uniref:uncharacterized protein n=1 Tax=Fomitiporia mediterranea (strain MF3/22) TaxID=694068 RepID=UPI0004409C05
DVLFLLDATASMDPYIKSAKERIIEICTILNASGRLEQDDGLQMGLLAYRDYPERDTEFVIKPHSFTFDVRDIKDQLHNLNTKTNADLAEAFRTALDYALTKMQGWRRDAVKVIIVVTDAAPHGIKENRNTDRYPNDGPEGRESNELRDPLDLAISKADEKYSIVVLACEPTLSKQTEYAIDFYRALADLSLGVYLPLTDHRALSTLILGSLLEKMDLKRLSDKYREDILKRVLKEGAPVESVIDELHEKLQNEGEHVMSVKSSNPYNDSDESIHNYKTFLSADTLKDARESLKVRTF